MLQKIYFKKVSLAENVFYSLSERKKKKISRSFYFKNRWEKGFVQSTELSLVFFQNCWEKLRNLIFLSRLIKGSTSAFFKKGKKKVVLLNHLWKSATKPTSGNTFSTIYITLTFENHGWLIEDEKLKVDYSCKWMR